MPGRHGKSKLGITQLTRTTGCNHQEGGPVALPRRAQKPVTELELTFGQLRKLSTKHSDCLPSLACLMEVLHNKPTDEEEAEALDAVNALRQERGLKRLG